MTDAFRRQLTAAWLVLLIAGVSKASLEHSHYSERLADMRHRVTVAKVEGRSQGSIAVLSDLRRSARYAASRWQELHNHLVVALAIAGLGMTFGGWIAWSLFGASVLAAGKTGFFAAWLLGGI